MSAEHYSSKNKLILLLGVSGTGKTTILRNLINLDEFETAPKYTTRPSRGTDDDSRDFIFVSKDEFPKSDVVKFESYGHLFGIQTDSINISFNNGCNHVLVIGDIDIANTLKRIFPDKVTVFYIYCDYEILRKRIQGNKHRNSRWNKIENEILYTYNTISTVDIVIDNSTDIDQSIEKLLHYIRPSE